MAYITPRASVAVPFFLGAIGMIALASSENGYLAILAIFVLLIGGGLLWRPGESAILFFIFFIQWIQVTIKVFQANFMGVPFSYLTEFGGDIEGAAQLSLIGLLAMALGARLGVGARRGAFVAELSRQISQIDIKKISILYVLTLALSVLSLALKFSIPALGQLLLPLASLRWAVFFVLTFVIFRRPGVGKSVWLLFFGFEIVDGLTGYFSSFKNVFFFALIALITGWRRWSLRKIFMLLILTLALGWSVLLWSSIKSEYRIFLSGGERRQIVVVSFEERIGKFIDLVRTVDSKRIDDAVLVTVKRISYIDFFGAVLNNVPQVVPHTDGELWIDALIRPIMPRLFFPDKPEIDDSKRTIMFSGIWVAGQDQGTSVSIGYVGESYIDFGPVGMMGVIFLYGYVIGFIYRWLSYTGASRGVLGMGLATTCLFGALLFESSITKIIGGIAASVLVFAFIRLTVLPGVQKWLTSRSVRAVTT